MPNFGDPENPTFCSTPWVDDPHTNPYDFPKTVLSQNTRLNEVLQDGPTRRS